MVYTKIKPMHNKLGQQILMRWTMIFFYQNRNNLLQNNDIYIKITI